MDIKEVLAKASKKEELNEEETKYLAEYDPDKAINTAAAAARKSVESKLKLKDTELETKENELRVLNEAAEALRVAAEEKENAGKPEVEKLTRELEKTRKAVADKETAIQKLTSEKIKTVRDGKINRIMEGVKFVTDIDLDIVRLGLDKSLAPISDADLDSEDIIKPLLEKFREKNKSILVDDSGHGAGGPQKGGGGGSTNEKSVDKMTAEERQEDLIKRKVL